MSEAVEAVEPQTEEQSVEDSQGLVQSSQSQQESDVTVEAETQEELVGEVQDAIENGATQEEVKSMIEEFELKVNGKTITRKLDLSDKDAIRAEMQKAIAGQMAMQQKADFERNVEGKFDEWKQNPKKFFEESGLDLDDFLHYVMDEKLEEAKKSPQQLQQEKIQAELEQARSREKELRDKIDKQDFERLQQEAAINLDNEISAALDAHTDLPKTPKVVKKIADVLLWANENGHENISVEDVIPTVQAELTRELNDMFETLPLETMEKYIGKQNFDRLRKSRIEKMSKKVPTVNEIKKEITRPAMTEENKAKIKKNFNDFMRRR